MVGTIHSPAGWKAAARLAPSAIDFVEIRLDAFVAGPEQALRAVSRLPFARILTVRDASEGGLAQLSAQTRESMYFKGLEIATAIDIEVRFLVRMKRLVAEARERGVAIIGSFHDFERMPREAKLRELRSKAADLGADCFKVAAVTASAKDLFPLLNLLAEPKNMPVAVMGMGAYGKVSRLLLAKAGSVLNYGFLDRSVASGQWPAPLLKERLAEL